MLDTSIIVHLLEGDRPRLPQRLSEHDATSLATSSIVFAEVMIGAVRAGDYRRASALLRTMPIHPFDERAGEEYARLSFKRGSFDRLIAAHALSLNLTVVTANKRDFIGLPGLQVEDWTE